MAIYAQKHTLIATISHGPETETPYRCMQAMIEDSEIQLVAKNRDSVGCVSDLVKVPGQERKRIQIVAVKPAKRIRSRMKKALPIVSRPRKVCVWEERRSAMPPVPMVVVYHAQVKCLMRLRILYLLALYGPSC